MLRNMLPYPREIEIIERSSTRLRRATETGRYSTVFSREIARMALCEATERLLIADQSNLKVRTEYNKNCQ